MIGIIASEEVPFRLVNFIFSIRLTATAAALLLFGCFFLSSLFCFLGHIDKVRNYLRNYFTIFLPCVASN